MKNPLRGIIGNQKASSSSTTSPEELQPQATEDTTTTPPREDVILDAVIIGAGWSGLGAGRHFWNTTKGYQFCILEGRANVGGRSRTLAPISEEYPESMIELGSQWIQGVNLRNKVYRLALQHDIMLHYDDEGGLWKNSNTRAAVWCDRLVEKESQAGSAEPNNTGNQQGTQEIQTSRLIDQKAHALQHSLMRGANGFYPFLEEYPYKVQGNRSVSVQHAMEEYIRHKKLSPQEQQFLKWLVEVDLTQEYAASLEDIDAEWWDHDKEYTGGELHFGFDKQKADRGSVTGGYSALVQKYAEPLLRNNLIHCHCVVTSIDYSSDPVVVEYVKMDPSAAKSSQSTTRHRIRAKSVLCTVPLGVLKAESIRFSPSLPTRKTLAIQRLGVGLYNKVVLIWNPDQRPLLPWLYPLDKKRKRMAFFKNHDPDETGKATHRMWMERIHLPGEQQGPWTQCYNAHTHHTATSPVVLYFFLAGRMAEQVEAFSNEEIQTQAMAALRGWFGPGIPDPQNVVLTRWQQDEMAKGSYSYYKVGSSPDDRKALAKPVDNRLYFAGEAIHLEYYATTHGALMSGVKTAKLMLRQRLKRRLRLFR